MVPSKHMVEKQTASARRVYGALVGLAALALLTHGGVSLATSAWLESALFAAGDLPGPSVVLADGRSAVSFGETSYGAGLGVDRVVAQAVFLESAGAALSWLLAVWAGIVVWRRSAELVPLALPHPHGRPAMAVPVMAPAAI